MNRVTVNAPVELTGVGLFSAAPATLTIAPADEAGGIVLTHDNARIPATVAHLSSRPVHPAFARMSPRCTCVGDEHATFFTIEHVMSALTGLGVTDALLALDAPQPHSEIPIMDGSALEFARMIQAIGLRQIPGAVEPVTLRERIVVESGDASITIEPSDAPRYAYTIDYPNDPIQTATVTWDGEPDAYFRDIAPARTFCVKREADLMRSAGLFTHLTTRDMLVIGEHGPIDNDYRLPDECARHKLLDLIGDLALVGGPLIASVTAVRSGHSLAHQAARRIVEQSALR